jgi:hypothetical protein
MIEITMDAGKTQVRQKLRVQISPEELVTTDEARKTNHFRRLSGPRPTPPADAAPQDAQEGQEPPR